MSTPLSLPRLAAASWRRARLECRRVIRGRVDPPRIRRLVIMLQSECALRCRMCDLWLEPKTRLPPESIPRLLASPALAPDASVHLTGGEPFLYPNFARLYSALRRAHPARDMTITTSGIPSGPVRDFLASKPDLRRTTLLFSYDGAGTHDAQRGRPGAEDELLSLVAQARRLAPRARLVFNCTLTPGNASSVAPTYRKARSLGVPIQFSLADDLPEYTNSRRRPAGEPYPLEPAARERLRGDLASVFNGLSLRSERPEIGHLLGQLRRLDDAASPGRRPGCPVPSQSAFVRSDGALLTCRGAAPVGDALRDGLEAAWLGADARRLRREGCGRCESRYAEF